MWWNTAPKENTIIEINPQELMNFIAEEVLFLNNLDQKLEKILSIESLLEGKTFFYLWEWISLLHQHFTERIQYFLPKEIKNP